jgi:hypothetical protein
VKGPIGAYPLFIHIYILYFQMSRNYINVLNEFLLDLQKLCIIYNADLYSTHLHSPKNWREVCSAMGWLVSPHGITSWFKSITSQKITHHSSLTGRFKWSNYTKITLTYLWLAGNPKWISYLIPIHVERCGSLNPPITKQMSSNKCQILRHSGDF